MESCDLHNPDFLPVGDHGIYDYFLLNTAALGDYPVFQHRFRDHMRSEFIADIEALPRTRVQKVDFMRLRQATPADPVYTEKEPRS